MKSIKKYETIINEALRSALEYDTPEGQINEFISFFGKHIGSDRIYIFEDDEEHHVTNNTYEWCAEGITPQIEHLQGVNMEVIDWWYDTFDEGKSVIISDVKELKGVHQVSYNMLKYQNVCKVVVSPLRHKGQIKGFFGVDNPPAVDYNALTMFLDMIGTMLISLLKIRNTFQKEQYNASMSSYSALSEIYLCMHLIDIKTGKYEQIKNVKHVEKECEELQKQLGLEVNPNKYMIGLISRLTDQKGLDLVRYAMDRLIDDNTQIVVIGTGDPSYEEMFRYYAWCNSDKVSANILYSDDLAHKLYAAADAFLMPSLFEPCGLTQIIAFHYGTIPIVRETGGLKDTVIPLNEFEDTGDGFSFSNYNGDELINTVNYSKYIYFEQPEIWDHMITRAMEKNLSWGVSKRRYEELYNTLIGR